MPKELYIIKIGGETLKSPESLENCLNAIAATEKPVILLHGGGRKVTELAALLNIEQKMVDGRRITSQETMELCTMVYAGLISKTMVANLASKNRNAIGISGADLMAIRSKKREHPEIYFGFVGDVVVVDSAVFSGFVNKKVIPVVCSVTMGQNFELLNTNADTMAAEVAKSMTEAGFSVKLIYCFEKKGVLLDVNDDNSLIKKLSQQDFNELKAKKEIADGMLPKLHTAFNALYHGVSGARIIHSSGLSELFAGTEVGTEISIH